MTKPSGMYETSPLQAIFTTISMVLAESNGKGLITEEQEMALVKRMNELLQGVLSGKVIVWQKGEISVMDEAEAKALAEAKDLPIVNEVGEERKPSSTLRIGGKK